MSPSQFKLSPLAFAAVLMVNSVAHAQSTSTPATDTAATDPQQLSTVVITASADASADGLSKAYAGGQVARGGRMGILGNVDMMSSPFNSTAYTQQFVADQQATSIGDVLQADPSVHTTRGYGNFQESYIIHGFELYSDDVGYNGLYGVLPRQYVSPELLERVEVLHGATSFVNGAAPGGSGLGGAINIVPKRAGNTPLTEVTAGLSSGGQGYGAVDIGRRFGTNQEFGVRVNASKRKGETGVDDEHSDVSLFTVGLDYHVGDLRLSADLGYQDFKMTMPRPSVNIGATVPSPTDSSSNYAQPWTYTEERDTFGTVRAEYDIQQNITAWAAFGGRAGVEKNSLAAPTVSAADGAATAYRFDNSGKRNTRTGEVGVRATLNLGSVKHTLVASSNGYWLDSRNAYIFGLSTFNTNIYAPTSVAIPTTSLLAAGDMANPGTTEKSILSSYAIADTMGFLDETVLLTVGARRQTVKDQSYAYGSAVADLSSHYDESATTPVAGIVYKVRKDVSLYANYTEGLVKGETVGSSYSNAGQIFAPYKTKTKEIGVKYDSGKLGATVALYTAAKPMGAGASGGLYSLNGEQRNRGMDISVFGVPMTGLRVLGGLSLLNAEQRDTADSGKDAIGAPKTQATAGVEWDVSGATGLSLNARMVYTGKQYVNTANTLDIGSWTRVDLGARYATRIADHDVTFRARIDNVADRSYWSSAVVAFNSGALVMGAPRTAVVSATVEF